MMGLFLHCYFCKICNKRYLGFRDGNPVGLGLIYGVAIGKIK